MRHSLLLTILERVCTQDNYFVLKLDACHTLELFPRQKTTLALYTLSYGLCVNAKNKYYRTCDSTAIKSLKWFCIVVRIEF
jgi:hypothetical protein